MTTNQHTIFSTSDYVYLAEAVLKHPGFEKGEAELKRFPDGESYHRILTPVEGKSVVLIGGSFNDAAMMEMYDMACGLVQQGAAALTMVIPYFSYSTMERTVKSGEIVKAKTRAVLFSSVPRTSFGNRILLFDLHTEGLPYYFHSDIRPQHIYCKPVIMEAAREIFGNDFVLASTDAGRAKWVESLANDMQVHAAFVYKRRIDGTETKLTGISADVKGKNVIIYDDMIRTGGSLIQAGKAYKEAGAEKIAVIATHGIFPGDGLKRLRDSGLFHTVICTDTHPSAVAQKDDFLKIKSIGTLIAENLREKI
ncbi:MAG: ribose-phosphate pyrophosphokinase [Bacteroidetes bacterium]|nr:MAG: ribose-phosphate pyrophosphokinase [Bacteroidota bacterium]